LCDGATLNKTALAALSQRVLLIKAPRNGGFAAGNNLFLRLLEDEDAYVWLLNPDMTVEPDTLPALVAEATRRPREVVVGCVVRSFHNPAQVLEFGGSRINFLTGTASTITAPEDVHRIDYISGGPFLRTPATSGGTGCCRKNTFCTGRKPTGVTRRTGKGWFLRCAHRRCATTRLAPRLAAASWPSTTTASTRCVS
jgi:hypothetical protein